MASDSEAILVQILRQFIETLPNHTDNEEVISNVQKKLPLIYKFLDRVLIDKVLHTTLYSQLQIYLTQLGTLKETDLCCSEVVDDRIFVATVHKAKGLEFDHVFVSDVNEGVYGIY